MFPGIGKTFDKIRQSNEESIAKVNVFCPFLTIVKWIRTHCKLSATVGDLTLTKDLEMNELSDYCSSGTGDMIHVRLYLTVAAYTKPALIARAELIIVTD